MFQDIVKYIAETSAPKLANEIGEKAFNIYTMRNNPFHKSIFHLIELQNFFRFKWHDLNPEKIHETLSEYKKARRSSFASLSAKTGICQRTLERMFVRTPSPAILFTKILQNYAKTQLGEDRPSQTES